MSLLEVEDGTIRLLFRDDNSHVPAAVSTFRRQSWHKDDAATEPGLWFRVVREDGSGREVEGLLDEEVVGRLSVRFEGDDMLRIDGYEMIPALRGQRYGVQLLGQAVQYARKQGRETLVLTCGEELSGYFAQYGFETVDRQGNDVEMKMDLRPAIREIPEPEEL